MCRSKRLVFNINKYIFFAININFPSYWYSYYNNICIIRWQFLLIIKIIIHYCQLIFYETTNFFLLLYFPAPNITTFKRPTFIKVIMCHHLEPWHICKHTLNNLITLVPVNKIEMGKNNYTMFRVVSSSSTGKLETGKIISTQDL